MIRSIVQTSEAKNFIANLSVGKSLIFSLLMILLVHQAAGQTGPSKSKQSLVNKLRVGQIVSFNSGSIVIEAESAEQSGKFKQNQTDVYVVTEIGKDYVAFQNHEYERFVNVTFIRQIIRKRNLKKPPATQAQQREEAIRQAKLRRVQTELMHAIAKSMVELEQAQKKQLAVEAETVKLNASIQTLEKVLKQENPEFVINGRRFTEKEIRVDLASRVADLKKRKALIIELKEMQIRLQESIQKQESKLKEITLDNKKESQPDRQESAQRKKDAEVDDVFGKHP